MSQRLSKNVLCMKANSEQEPKQLKKKNRPSFKLLNLREHLCQLCYNLFFVCVYTAGSLVAVSTAGFICADQEFTLISAWTPEGSQDTFSAFLAVCGGHLGRLKQSLSSWRAVSHRHQRLCAAACFTYPHQGTTTDTFPEEIQPFLHLRRRG